MRHGELSDSEVNGASAVTPDDEEYPEEVEGRGWDDEEVHADKSIPVMAEESFSTPEAIIGYRPLGKVPGGRAFIDDDAEFEQLAVNS